ncbi:MAG: hypothetical protein Q4E50_04775 [Tissierellia bacterium]|nr:hypothetical protein [Tissierellia bacterium]
MKLKNYRKDLENRASLYVVFIGLALVFLLLGELLLKDLIKEDSKALTYVVVFAIVIELINLYQLGKIWKALKDENVLTEMYIKESDEREQLINLKSGYPVVTRLSMILITAAILLGFFDDKVFFTLILVAILQALIAFTLKLYWKKRI